ncbi:membrane protein insertion efficiency factor YidD [Prosthecochloris sp. SCSIO W1101]|uniref:membrane protein insertion efficiency factor YidD n=1 Tax=Prosthecochloris sp. SCSIO W1101 TaxID=2992242 RepID=UPI00223D9D9E|nr:membrane protein insertion efficiency factor YidD [Prosthecochloris sp. SCSIO W1101]UZJ41434.1 membrane protein insertion efficiency factor YidD [Prosthecochloris sp. SCSIO W1101]
MELNAFWKIINQVPILLIKFYRLYISPLLGPSCRFYPTCSNYALEAFRTHNFFYALWLTVWRVMRCNPFSKGGYDPVPLSGEKLKSKERDNG